MEYAAESEGCASTGECEQVSQYGRTMTAKSGAVLTLAYSPTGGERFATCSYCDEIIWYESLEEVREHECKDKEG